MTLFSAGPAVLPKEVLKKLRLSFGPSPSGMSVMELSHRSKRSDDISSEAEKLAAVSSRKLFSYTYSSCRGRGPLQFSMIRLISSRAAGLLPVLESGQKAYTEAVQAVGKCPFEPILLRQRFK